ncbi:MAG: thiol reductant ABC exporter subunit CydD [Hyphomonadaceae bacterium]
MTDDSKRIERSRARAAISKWLVSAKRFVGSALLAQVLAVLGWIAFAWGTAHAAGAIVNGRPPGADLALALAGVVARTGFLWISEHMAAKAGAAFTAAARRDVLGAFAESGAGFLGGANAGERTSQIIDRTAKLSAYAANWLPGMRLVMFGPVLVLVAVAFQSWLAAVLLVVSVVTTPVFIWLTTSQTAAAARAQQSSLDALSGAFQARTANAGLIRAFRAIGRERAALQVASEDLRARTMSILRIAFLSTAVLEFFASVSIALVAVYIGFKLLGVFPFETGETITLAEGLTALILAPEFFAPIRRLSGLHHDRADGMAAAQMLSTWIADGASTPATRLAKMNHAPRIRFADVSLAYGDGEAAVRGVSFEAGPGEMIALSGPSGSGKSSCLLALIGRVRATGGTIEIDGGALGAGESLADSVAFLRQTPWVSEGSVAENIALARPGASRAEIEAAAKAAGVDAFASAERGGLDLRLERFGTGLSGGQRQRLALARAILRDAPIWLLDEPTAHLDADAEATFLKQLPELARGRTVVIATHSEAVKAACSRVFDMPAPVAKADAA